MKDTENEQMDLQMDKLLKNHLKNNPAQSNCSGFDADMATAYAERTLTNIQIKTYEVHLADCKNCRQMTAEYMLLFAAELPVTQEAKEIKEVKEIKEITPLGQTNLSTWEAIKEWLFGSQIRWAIAAILILFVSGAIWVFSGKNSSSNEVVENPTNAVKTTPEPNKLLNPVDGSQTANNENNGQENAPISIPTSDNNVTKTPDQDKTERNNLEKPPIQNEGNYKENVELANKGVDKPNSIKLPSVGKQDNLPEVAGNNKATPTFPTNDNLQIPPPPQDIAQNVEKNVTKDTTTNSGTGNTTKKGSDFGFGVAENSLDKKSVGGKVFLLKGGVWTDQEYINNAKVNNLKRVELKKDSEDYKKVISSDSGLKSYFSIGASVTVVYKDTVYIIKK